MQAYKELKFLGQGAGGEVLLVQERKTLRFFVLKRILFQGLGVVEKERTKQEVRVLQHLDHQNIVLYEASFSTSTHCHIIMEYCKNGSVEALILRRNGSLLQPEVILEWMVELLSAVNYLHSKKIIHRDIKTSNIFLSEKNHVKLGDFGVCKQCRGGPRMKAETLLGTPQYMAPELCEGEPYDEKTDIWSLGVVFYELCTLRLPFEAANVLGLIQQVTSDNPIDPIPSVFDGRFQDVISQMLQRDPKRRSSAQQLLESFKIPESHPSHPQYNVAKARQLQQNSGPDLEGAEPKAKGDPPKKRFSKSGGSKPTPKKELIPDTDSSSSDTAEAPEPEAKVVAESPEKRPRGKVSPMRQAAPAGRVLSSVMSPPPPNGKPAASPLRTTINESKLVSAAKHSENLERIKNAKSKVSIEALRRQMKDRRYEANFGDSGTDVYLPRSIVEGSPLNTPSQTEPRAPSQRNVMHWDPVVISNPSSPEKRSQAARSSAISSPFKGSVGSSSSKSSLQNSSEPRPAFVVRTEEAPTLKDKLLEQTSNHSHLTAEDLDDAIEALRRYRIEHFGSV